METLPKRSQKKQKKIQKKQKKRGHKVLAVIVGILVVFGVLLAAGIAVERQMVKNKVNDVVSSLASQTSIASSSFKMSPSTPAEIASNLNKASQSIVSGSKGLVSSATATATDSAVTYTVKTSAVNTAEANILLATNGDQLQQIADQALDSMSAKGVANPKLTINLTDTKGNVIKSLTYSK